MFRYLVKLGYSEPMLRSLTTSQLTNLYHARLYLENKENWFFQSVLSGFCEHDYRVWSFNGGKNARRAVRLQNVRYRGYDFALTDDPIFMFPFFTQESSDGGGGSHTAVLDCRTWDHKKKALWYINV